MYKLYDNVIYSYINLPDVTQLLIKYYDFFLLFRARHVPIGYMR